MRWMTLRAMSVRPYALAPAEVMTEIFRVLRNMNVSW